MKKTVEREGIKRKEREGRVWKKFCSIFLSGAYNRSSVLLCFSSQNKLFLSFFFFVFFFVVVVVCLFF